MNKPFYLSIDLDFWNLAPAEVVATYLEKVTALAKKKRIPIRAFMNHHHMLDAVNRCPVDVFVNIDEHSDLADTENRGLNCGTWVGYIKWRKRGRYIWFHSKSANHGDCSGGCPNIFLTSGRINTDIIDWKSIKHEQVVNAKFDPTKLMENCKEVGVVLSPAYADWYLHKVFYEWYKKYRIPYKYGRRSENQERWMIPPK